MSNLTRRVLATVQTDPVVTVCTVPDNDVATLARQVEAVEALADWLENEADAEVARGDTWDAQCIRNEGRRIRNALTEAEEGNTP